MPPSKLKQGHAGPSSVLGSILKNEPRMIRPNPGGISTRGTNPTSLLNKSFAPGVGSSPGSTRYGGTRNSNLARDKRGLLGLGARTALDQSMQSMNQASTVHTMAKKNSAHVVSQQNLSRPSAQQPAPQAGDEEAEESAKPADTSILGLFSSLMGGTVNNALGQKKPSLASPVKESKESVPAEVPADTQTSPVNESRYGSRRDGAYSSQVKTPSLLDLVNKRSGQHQRPPLPNATPARGAMALR